MKHLSSLIHRSLVKAYLIWTLCLLFLGGLMVFYGAQRQKLQTINEQIYTLMRVDSEAALSYALFRDNQKTMDTLPPLFTSWLESRARLLTVMPDMEITLRNVEKSGRALYTLLRPPATNMRPPSTGQLSEAYLDFRKQADSLATPLLNYVRKPTRAEFQALGVTYWEKSAYYFIEGNGVVILPLLWLLSCLVLYWASVSAVRKIRGGSEEVLDILWANLKNQEPRTLEQEFDFESLKENAYALAEESQDLFRRLGVLRESVHLPEAPPNVPQPAPRPDTGSKDQLVYIQKLLARLFTRAERTAALAKAAGSNGFQAGILALNVSIEAARAGENGRPFLSVSDKIKDFGEKSSRIGEAILEEIKDADSAIRKAYASAKGLLESFPLPAADAPPPVAPPSMPEGLEETLKGMEDLLYTASHIQQLARGLEEKCLAIPAGSPGDSEESMETREAVLQSFEKLYRLSYGDTPPSHVFRN